MKWKLIIAFGAIIAYIGPHVVLFFTVLGYHKSVYNQAPGQCRQLPEIARGSEDIQTLPSGLAFISSGFRFIDSVGNPNFEGVTGKIYLFDFNHPSQPAVELAIQGGLDLDEFIPHGISVIEKGGNTFLYVVNHFKNFSTSIEKFVFKEKSQSLFHQKTWLDTHIRYVNDVVAVDEDEFYFTNYMYLPSNLEPQLGLKWHSIGYCLKDNCRLVVENLLLPNGINTSPDKKYIYIANIISRSISVFSRSDDSSLVLLQEYPLYEAVDNIDVDRETGDLWCGAHPVGHKLMAYIKDPKTASPSLVLKLKTADGLISGVSQVYSNDGTEISASSVAVRHGDAMLVGAVVTPPIYCSLEYVTP